MLAPDIIPRDTLTEDNWMPIPYWIEDKKVENDTMISFLLRPAGEQQIEPLHPGQFVMLYAFGIGEIPISVSSLLYPDAQFVQTIQDVGKISKHICQLNVGDQLGVRGPYGNTWPIADARGKDVVIVAGGVGIAPLRPVIEEIVANREAYGEVNIFYGARNPRTLIFHQDLISWQADPTIDFHITVDHSYKNWRGNVGVVTRLIDHAKFKSENTRAFVCGPEVMMRLTSMALIDAGMSEEDIHVSMERNMKCGFGHCGHCQYGPYFICKDGAVFNYGEVKNYLKIREL